MEYMPQLSVVLAVHNEERMLGQCLDAVTSIADEYVIVDGESTDNTVAIAKQFSAVVISTTNKANFHINKQMAIDAARFPLVLQLDADEIVDAELLQFIDSIKHQPMPSGDATPVAWQIARKNHFLNRWLSKGGQYPDMVIRLFYAGKARLPQQNVHEQLQVDGEVATANGHLLHFANPTLQDYMVKFNRYTSFEALRLKSEGTQVPSTLKYCIIKPIVTFFLLYFRHRGYVDGMAGFAFALLSALHPPFVWIKYQEFLYEHSD